jgi:hypothetical protein
MKKILMRDTKTQCLLRTTGMPSLTVADALHNLPYSFDGHGRSGDLKSRNWDRISPLLGLLNLIDGVL